MRKTKIILQILLGLIFVVFGLNKFFGFISMPPLNETATNFMMSLGSSKYLFPLIGIIEIVCGLLLVSNRFVTISLLLLVPITFNILGFHLFLDQGGLVMSVIMSLILTYLIYDRKDNYKTLLKN